jgi:hypothetical protein
MNKTSNSKEAGGMPKEANPRRTVLMPAETHHHTSSMRTLRSQLMTQMIATTSSIKNTEEDISTKSSGIGSSTRIARFVPSMPK